MKTPARRPCDINSKWDCGEVNHSEYAELKSIPVAIIGIVGYALLAALARQNCGFSRNGFLMTG